ncbi:tetratricopeptide repeat protein [Oryzomonas sagensis]|uniref:Tetratricopeptide repeat protein n=1 Tax=Oryzomonas sagensis TaxID=2603857 RepID=A0ABQ6TPN9_9BACT|nr:tetratricopeptide repeat protein [Oryzomonas sagensis]KAB0670554.1 tetratricopeptide repeat protein [Oryzomonas sagensis]
MTLAGEKRAEEMILRALTISGLSLNVPSGGATLELAKRLVLKNIATLTDPQWELVTSTHDTELFEVLAKRFPDKEKRGQAPPDLFQATDRYSGPSSGDDMSRHKARTVYILGLIALNRVKDATEQAKRMDPEEFQNKEFEKKWHSFDKIRYADGLNQFCKSVLTDRPELPLWKQCGVIASNVSESEGLVAIVDAAAKKSDVGFETRLGIRERQVELLLALDRVDDAVSLLREMIKADAGRETPKVQRGAGFTKLRLAARMCTLGMLLARPDLVKESEDAFLAVLGNEGMRINLSEMTALNVMDTDSPLGVMVDAYLEKGDFAGAENMVVTAMQVMLKAPELTELPGGRELALSSGFLAGHLARLAEIYDRAGRHEDVLSLLEKAAWWGGTDLVDLAEGNNELPAVAARALHAAGRDSLAVEILKSYLLGKPGDDSAYATLTEILGPAVIPWLDGLQARDRFEERPLIWKAQLLLKAGKLDEAEATVRQALKIDPTDGEQKPGNRGRAYVVLADTLRAKGRAEDAAFFDRVVTAIHTAETGDKFTEAGLVRKSIAVYEEASKSFVDAYCVQWRLAERLSSLGDLKAAKKHYEIAFERMPEQFGQVASFCFGCEGVFTHQQSVSVAEEVLTGLVTSTPRKPQVHYLLGQLRESQGRKAEAYRHFLTAADLDPHYLDALKAAYGLRKDVFLSQAEADQLALRMVRLDPLNRHGHLSAGDISDLKGLWSIYEEKGRDGVTIPKTLLTLSASKQELEALLKKFGASSELLELKHNTYRSQRRIPEPGDAVVKNAFVNKLLQATGQGGQMLY